MLDGQVVICCALELEARAVERALNRSRSRAAVHVVGIGARKLPAQLVPGARIAAVLSVGLAGALDPALRCGDVVVDDPTNWLQLNGSFPCRLGRIHTADRMVASGSQKAELFRLTHGALAVDMETRFLRDACDQLGLPCVAIRSIYDTADETLDPNLLNLVDDRGRPNARAVTSLLVRRPLLLPQLLRMRARSRVALTELTRVLSKLPADRRG
jgi:nucleoside phosphorylase